MFTVIVFFPIQVALIPVTLIPLPPTYPNVQAQMLPPPRQPEPFMSKPSYPPHESAPQGYPMRPVTLLRT